MVNKIANYIDIVTGRIGRSVAWLALFMVLMMFFNVISRYIFDTNLIWQQELVGISHSIIFLLASGYTLLEDKHVRVDIIYDKLTIRNKAIIDVAGTFLFLFPFCMAIIFFSADFIINAWKIKEASSEYNGVLGVFLLKTCIWIFSISLLLQGISTICKSIVILRGPK